MSSGRWQALYTHPITRRRETAPTLFTTAADAKRWLSMIETDLSRGELPDPENRRVRFDEYAADWLAGKPGLRPKTTELYEYLLRLHVVPYFGEMAIGYIDASVVRAWHATLIEAGVSKGLAAKAYRILRQIMAAAVDDRLLRENPCRIRGATVEAAPERQIPSVEQVMALAKAVDPRYRAMVYLAAFVGLRRGECFGLARRHFNLDIPAPTVRVERQVVHLDSGTHMQEPKTAAGTRTVVMPDFVATQIATHLEQFVDEGPDSLVFPAPRGGVITKVTWRRIWGAAVENAGYEGTFHDLRHVAGTLNAVAGATLKEAMARLGHSSSAAALRYQHAGQLRDAEVASRVNGLIGGVAINRT